MTTDFGKILLQFGILAILLKLVVGQIFRFNFVKQFVEKEGIYFKGSDLKKGTVTVFAILFCIIFDYRFISLAFDLVPVYPELAKWIDYFFSGILLGGGTRTLHDFLKEQRKLKELGLQEKTDSAT